jgi:hypothetical protein
VCLAKGGSRNASPSDNTNPSPAQDATPAPVRTQASRAGRHGLSPALREPCSNRGPARGQEPPPVRHARMPASRTIIP